MEARESPTPEKRLISGGHLFAAQCSSVIEDQSGGNPVSVPDAPNQKSQLARKMRLSRHLKPGTTAPPVNTSIGRVSASMESAV